MIASQPLSRLILTIFLSLLIATIIFLGSVRAELAQPDEARLVADNFVTQMLYQKGDWAGDQQATVSGVNPLYNEGTLVGWIYNISPKGFVLVSALKEMNPIVAYSDESNMDESREGGPLSMMREALGQRFTAFEDTYGSLDADQPAGQELFDPSGKASWERLAVSTSDFVSEIAQARISPMTEGGPLTTTAWHQSGPYNNYCPMGDGGRTVVGCVATATAQVMAYWQWPPSGVGSYSYTWGGDVSCDGSTPSQTLSADFSDPYDWANIPNDCDGGCSSAQNAALAELCYEVGVSHSMDYGACGSGAWTGGAANVLRDYFKYSPEIEVVSRTSYTRQQWFDMMAEEINAGRVAQYRINLHSIVMDGYRDNMGALEFHMNYGWGNGGFNAWDVIDELYCSWVTGDVCPYDEEYMIWKIFPQTNPALSYASFTCDDPAGDGDGHGEAGEELSLMVKIQNNGADAFNSTATLTCSDPNVTILDGATAFGSTIAWGEESQCQTPFRVQLSPSVPDPYWIEFEVSIAADGGHTANGSFVIFVGNTAGLEDDMESGAGYWAHTSIRTGYVDQWHLSTYRKHSGTTSWKMGGPNATSYSDASDAALVTPPVLLPPNAGLTFWHWMNAETAWDGGIVMISTLSGDWEQIFPDEGYTHNIVDNAASPFASETPCYSGAFGWTQTTFDLKQYAGQIAQIMFRFGSDGAENAEGWYVDDISLYSTGCCGAYTGGMAGNTDCSTNGARNLADITRLIDRVYISKLVLCCEENGNVDGDAGGGINLADITRLIDHVYISRGETAPCL